MRYPSKGFLHKSGLYLGIRPKNFKKIYGWDLIGEFFCDLDSTPNKFEATSKKVAFRFLLYPFNRSIKIL